MTAPKITFIGAGSTIFVKNILGDVFHREALKSAHVALMDIDETRLEESHIVVRETDGLSGRFWPDYLPYQPESGATGCGFRGGRLSDWRL
ncbi:hypothetical protein A9Y87_09130 [Salmonella enterica subsp. enterica]|nr:hypothetical protein A9Y87_09130 [Salmonella enterica subsp. enterica]